MTHARTGTAPVADTHLHYEVSGRGPALLLLHGFTLDRRMWRAQADALAERHTVVAYDARGFGRSGMPGAASYRHADDAAALIEHLGLGPVIVVGHSIGAHQLLELALTRPDLARGYVSIAMSGLASVPFSADLVALFSELRRLARSEGVAAAKALWSTCGWFTHARLMPEVAALMDEMLADYPGLHWTGDGRALPLDPPAAARLSEVRMPALIINGAHDLPYNQDVKAALAAGLPHARVLDVPAGHMVPLEAPATVNAALAEFAARCA